jgi:hypothetical protein
MNTSRLLARLIGPLFLAIGAGLFLNSAVYYAMSQEFLRSLSLIYLSGFLTLLAGIAIVNFHNLWVSDWRVIITIFGWLAVIGGAVRLILPQAVQSVGGTMLASPAAQTIGGVVVLALGAWLTYAGYLEKTPKTSRAKRRGKK